MTGSTDVGDVSWVVPTVQAMVTCLPNGIPAHSWQWVAAGQSEMLHKGVLAGGKAVAMTVYDLLTDKKLLKEAKEEHIKNLNGKEYRSLIPAEVVPH